MQSVRANGLPAVVSAAGPIVTATVLQVVRCRLGVAKLFRAGNNNSPAIWWVYGGSHFFKRIDHKGPAADYWAASMDAIFATLRGSQARIPLQATRIERDALGEVAVPAQALYGAQTQRAIDNFPLDGEHSIGFYTTLITALAGIKRAAAGVNVSIGALSSEIGGALDRAARSVVEDGRWAQFPVHRLHGGGGTSANMNANEVLANLAEGYIGGLPGRYERVHPNDHVNLHQSTNDVYPTACHMAVILQWPGLRGRLEELIAVLLATGARLGDGQRLARTCLQDAVATGWADFFGGCAAGLGRQHERLERAVDALHLVNLGGTIVGRPSDAPLAYRERIVGELAAVSGDPAYEQAANLFDAAQNADDLAAVSAALDLLARGLVKIGKDLRLLSSGPDAGFGELRLPAVQPGSSVMPGKVNPVIPEFLIQICLQVSANHAAVAAGLDHAELDLNVWESRMVFNILDSMRMLKTAVGATTACVSGIDADTAGNARHATATIPALSDMMRAHGYARVAAAWREGGGDLDAVRASLERVSENQNGVSQNRNGAGE